MHQTRSLDYYTVISQIFELQCSLLEDGVTDALLRECAIWFRPSHLQDIIIERSEAEALCGWPACRNPLHTWAKTATLVFEVPGGENSARFCGKACAAVRCPSKVKS